jgi:hypothetical protein
MGYVVAGVLVAAVVVALVTVALAGGGDDDSGGSGAKASAGWPSGSIPEQKIEDLDAAAKAAGCTYKKVKSEGAGHVEGRVNYKSQPPTSGAHYPVPSHDAANLKAPRFESLIHALEHGRVVYWFKPSASADARGALKKLYDEDNKLVVLTPNPRPMPYEVAASAWEYLVGCPAYNEKVIDAFRAFRDERRLKGPEYFPNAE